MPNLENAHCEGDAQYDKMASPKEEAHCEGK